MLSASALHSQYCDGESDSHTAWRERGCGRSLSETRTTSFRFRPALGRLASIRRFAATQPARLRMRPAGDVTSFFHTLLRDLVTRKPTVGTALSSQAGGWAPGTTESSVGARREMAGRLSEELAARRWSYLVDNPFSRFAWLFSGRCGPRLASVGL